MRIEYIVHAKITEDADGKDVLWNPDKTLATSVITNMGSETGGKFSIPASGVENLSLGDVASARAIAIEFDADANISLNGGTEVFQIRRPDTTVGRKARFFWEGTITQVRVTNPSSTAVLTGRHVLWGDPTS